MNFTFFTTPPDLRRWLAKRYESADEMVTRGVQGCNGKIALEDTGRAASHSVVQ